MDERHTIAAALSLDALGGDARAGFEVAAEAGYRGIAFATNHRELNPEVLGTSGRRHLKAILAGKRLGIEAVRAAGPRGGLAEAATIDRALESARRTMVLARELGVKTVDIDVGRMGADAVGGEKAAGQVAEGTLIAALRELAQQADAAGLTLALGGDSIEALGRIIKAVDFQRAAVNLDAARAIGAGEDVLKAAEGVAAIGQFTAADAVRRGASVRAAMLGEGQLALPEILEILQERGFRGPVVVDVRDLPDGAAGARHAAEVLRRAMR